MVDDIRILATIDCDACDVDSDIVWANYNEMSIEGFIAGLVLLVAPVEQVSIVEKVWKATVLTDKALIKSHEGTWGASAHEEKYQIIKDGILIIGGIK